MNDHAWSRCSVIAVCGWLVVAAMLLGAWLIMAITPDQYTPHAFLLGLSGCATSALVGVISIRTYLVRLARMIRVIHRTDDARVTPLR